MYVCMSMCKLCECKSTCTHIYIALCCIIVVAITFIASASISAQTITTYRQTHTRPQTPSHSLANWIHTDDEQCCLQSGEYYLAVGAAKTYKFLYNICKHVYTDICVSLSAATALFLFAQMLLLLVLFQYKPHLKVAYLTTFSQSRSETKPQTNSEMHTPGES